MLNNMSSIIKLSVAKTNDENSKKFIGEDTK